ncbi:MAG: PrsW family intramembrane metalloprotease [Thermoanaerobaculales bacterium]|nr:PrsW family intramembrane metalloprotease [Thermoanaerobaculales bacterium]
MTGLELAALGAALLVASVLLFTVVLLVWWVDRYDREPLPLLFGVLFWGMVIAPGLVGFAASLEVFQEYLSVMNPALDSLGVFGAAALEEGAKGLGILLVILFSRHFDNPTDGLVYGTAVGLGFAITENLFHGLGASILPQTVMLKTIIGRTLYTAGVHALASSVFGAGLGLARLSGRAGARWLWSVTGFVLAVLLHGGWNQVVITLGLGVSGGYHPWLILLPLYLLYAGTFGLLLHAEHRILIRQLADEVRLGVLPGWTVTVIPYYRRRIRSGWWPSRPERAVISRLLTKLAFRKHALASAGTSGSSLDGLELVSLRKHIQSILRPVEDGPDSHDHFDD